MGRWQHGVHGVHGLAEDSLMIYETTYRSEPARLPMVGVQYRK